GTGPRPGGWPLPPGSAFARSATRFPGTAVEPDRLALFEERREDELDAAALYRALADASQGRRRDVLNRLAEAEERHAGHWERLLREAGVTEFPVPKKTLRTRMLSLLAHRFGA